MTPCLHAWLPAHMLNSLHMTSQPKCRISYLHVSLHAHMDRWIADLKSDILPIYRYRDSYSYICVTFHMSDILFTCRIPCRNVGLSAHMLNSYSHSWLQSLHVHISDSPLTYLTPCPHVTHSTPGSTVWLSKCIYVWLSAHMHKPLHAYQTLCLCVCLHFRPLLKYRISCLHAEFFATVSDRPSIFRCPAHMSITLWSRLTQAPPVWFPFYISEPLPKSLSPCTPVATYAH